MRLYNCFIVVVIIAGAAKVSPLTNAHTQDELTPSANAVDGQGPQEDSVDYVHFKLYRPGLKAWVPISVDNSTEYLDSLFKPDALTRFIVHGWLGSENSDIVNHTAGEYRKAEAGNVVKVDWSYTAGWKFYPLSALQTAYIGGVIAALINKLLFFQFIRLENLHLIGHSLGAHVMGNAGSMIKGKPARITGLDPAKPGFEGIMDEQYRLDKSDAHFVDIIHSAAGAAGYYGTLGHVDFYPNGGTPPQPGCLDMSQPWLLVGCSHSRSYYYYIESISDPSGFPAVQCNSWAQFKSGSCENNTKIFMGDATPPTARGVYYLETNSQAPFAKG